MKYLILPALFAAGCSTGCSTMKQNSSAPSGQAIRIELKGKPGSSSETRYYSNANVKTYSSGQLIRDKMEGVEFTTVTKIKSFDPAESALSFSVSTTEKDGAVQLHDLAFPEKFETIDYVVRTDGTVMKAGKHPPQSLFFVPSLPIPKEPVQVGDTWTMEHTWVSASSGVPVRLEIVGILKALVPCGGVKCADIEVSGGVNLVDRATAQGTNFTSKIWGRILYSPERGDIVWSEMRSREEMQIGPEKLSVLSCMISETKLSAKYKLKLACEPAEKAVTAVPANL